MVALVMTTHNSTSNPGSASTPVTAAKAAPVPAFVCDVADPVASVAEWVVTTWLQSYATNPVALLVVPQQSHSALVEAVRLRFANLDISSPSNPTNDGLLASVQVATDSGASLIAGGLGGRPSLVVNVLLSGRLLDALQTPAPVLLVVCQEENLSAVEDLAERLQLHPFAAQASSNS